MSRAAPYPTLGVTAARWRSCRRPPPAIPHPPPHPPAPGVPQCRARPPYTWVLGVPLAARARSAAPCRCCRPLAAPRAGRRTRRSRHRLLPSRRTPWPLRATEITNRHHVLKVRTPVWRRDAVDVVPQRQRGCGSFTQAAPGSGACLGPAVPFQGGIPLESPATALPAWGWQGCTPPRARWAAAPQQRRAADAGYAAAPGQPDLWGGRPSALRRDARPARLRRPWRAARSSAAGVVRGAPDRAPRRCGLRAARGSCLPALSPAAGEATVAPDGRARGEEA
jgi:hypothetical protein